MGESQLVDEVNWSADKIRRILFRFHITMFRSLFAQWRLWFIALSIAPQHHDQFTCTTINVTTSYQPIDLVDQLPYFTDKHVVVNV